MADPKGTLVPEDPGKPTGLYRQSHRSMRLYLGEFSKLVWGEAVNGHISPREMVLIVNWKLNAKAQRRGLSKGCPGTQWSPWGLL